MTAEENGRPLGRRRPPAALRREAGKALLTLPEIHVTAFRRALVQHAALDDSIINSLTFEGSAAAFCAGAAEACGQSEAARCGRHPLAALVLAAADYLGVERRAALGELAERIERAADPNAPASFEVFLEALGLGGAAPTSYSYMERTFVQPRQYDEIARILDEHHAVFILGDPHMGKTYTAIHMLWRAYAQLGHQPRWVTAGQMSAALTTSPGDFLARLADLLPEKAAVYIEDPFGSVTPVDLPEFVGNLRRFLTFVAGRECRVVISSRTAVFNQVVIDSLTEFVVVLTRSLDLETAYSEDQLTEIARRYIDAYGPAWADQCTDTQRRAAAEDLARALPAPHNIELFVRNTVRAADWAQASRELSGHRDVASEFGRMIRILPLWQQAFLVIVDACGAGYLDTADPSLIPALFEAAAAAGDLGKVELVSADMALDALEGYIITHSGGRPADELQVRHPSITEGLARCARGEPALAEVIRRLVRRAASGGGAAQWAAFLMFLRYSDLMWSSPMTPAVFDALLESEQVRTREAARLLLIHELKHVPAGAREPMLAHIEQTWNDRFLLRLLLNAPLEEPRRLALAARLTRSWDDWVRYRLASNLRYVFAGRRDVPEVEALRADQVMMIRRRAEQEYRKMPAGTL